MYVSLQLTLAVRGLSALRLDGVPASLMVVLSLAAIATECFLALALWFRVSRRVA